MDKTNDFCESELGIFRQASRKSPNLSLVVHNSREMYARNHTSTYIKRCSPAMRKFFRRMARLQDESGANVQQRREIVQVCKNAANKRAERAENLEQKKRQRREKQARVIPVLTVTESVHLAFIALRTEGYMTLERINCSGCLNMASSAFPRRINQRGKERPERLALWLKGVREYVDSGAVRGPEVDVIDDDDENEPEDEAAAISKALGDDEDDGEDELYDSEEEWYEGDA
ncbi:hypothetical protein B0H10DRAFT_1951842 [Mycena sp. CBHHK59/15]|nr:hypothetical protein B0H10DRAFT_1973338 [Mycena sp. CBHHK59/15]KAJ6613047.1 hypothetical protein B0H10DRAFT_1951842 [Mycena sp. CBHHK59/15]